MFTMSTTLLPLPSSASKPSTLTRRQLRENSSIGSDDMTAIEVLNRLKWGDKYFLDKYGTHIYAVVSLLIPRTNGSSSSSSSVLGRGTCRNFVRFGSCKYGTGCRYMHQYLPLQGNDLIEHAQATGLPDTVMIARSCTLTTYLEYEQTNQLDATLLIAIDIDNIHHHIMNNNENKNTNSSTVNDGGDGISLHITLPPVYSSVYTIRHRLWSVYMKEKELWNNAVQAFTNEPSINDIETGVLLAITSNEPNGPTQPTSSSAAIAILPVLVLLPSDAGTIGTVIQEQNVLKSDSTNGSVSRSNTGSRVHTPRAGSGITPNYENILSGGGDGIRLLPTLDTPFDSGTAPRLDTLPSSIMTLVASFVTPKCLASLSCVSVHTRASLHDIGIWGPRLQQCVLWNEGIAIGRIKYKGNESSSSSLSPSRTTSNNENNNIDSTTLPNDPNPPKTKLPSVSPPSLPQRLHERRTNLAFATASTTTNASSSVVSTVNSSLDPNSYVPLSLASKTVVDTLIPTDGSYIVSKNIPQLQKAFYSLVRLYDWAKAVRYLPELHTIRTLGIIAAADLAPPEAEVLVPSPALQSIMKDGGNTTGSTSSTSTMMMESSLSNVNPSVPSPNSSPSTISRTNDSSTKPSSSPSSPKLMSKSSSAMNNRTNGTSPLLRSTSPMLTALHTTMPDISLAEKTVVMAMLDTMNQHNNNDDSIDYSSNNRNVSSPRTPTNNTNNPYRSSSNTTTPTSTPYKLSNAGSTIASGNGASSSLSSSSIPVVPSTGNRTVKSSYNDPTFNLRRTLRLMLPILRGEMLQVAHIDPVERKTLYRKAKRCATLTLAAFHSLVEPGPANLDARGSAEMLAEALAGIDEISDELDEMNIDGTEIELGIIGTNTGNPNRTLTSSSALSYGSTTPSTVAGTIPPIFSPVPVSSTLSVAAGLSEYRLYDTGQPNNENSTSLFISTTSIMNTGSTNMVSNPASSTNTAALTSPPNTTGTKKSVEKEKSGSSTAASGTVSSSSSSVIRSSVPVPRGLGISSAFGVVRGGQSIGANVTGCNNRIITMAIDQGRLAILDRSGTLRVYGNDGSRLAAGRATGLAVSNKNSNNNNDGNNNNNDGTNNIIRCCQAVCSMDFVDTTIATGHPDGSVIISSLGTGQAIRASAGIRYDESSVFQSLSHSSGMTTTRSTKEGSSSSGKGTGGSYYNSFAASSIQYAHTKVAFMDDGASILVGRMVLRSNTANALPGPLVLYATDTGTMIRSLHYSTSGLTSSGMLVSSPTVIKASGPHTAVVGYTCGTMRVWDLRASREAMILRLNKDALPYRPPSFTLESPSSSSTPAHLVSPVAADCALQHLHVRDSHIMEARESEPYLRGIDHGYPELNSYSSSIVRTWDLRALSGSKQTTTGPYMAIDLGENALSGISGLYFDHDRILMTHRHVYRPRVAKALYRKRITLHNPRTQQGPARSGIDSEEEEEETNLRTPQFHWNARDRHRSLRVNGTLTLNENNSAANNESFNDETVPISKKKFVGRLYDTLQGNSINTSLIPEYAYPYTHGPLPSNVERTTLFTTPIWPSLYSNDDKRNNNSSSNSSKPTIGNYPSRTNSSTSRTPAAGTQGSSIYTDHLYNNAMNNHTENVYDDDDDNDDDDEEENDDDDNANDNSPFRYHLPGIQPVPRRPAVAEMQGLSVWHPHTGTMAGWVPLASAFCLTAEPGGPLVAVGGNQGVQYWHTTSTSTSSGMGTSTTVGNSLNNDNGNNTNSNITSDRLNALNTLRHSKEKEKEKDNTTEPTDPTEPKAIRKFVKGRHDGKVKPEHRKERPPGYGSLKNRRKALQQQQLEKQEKLSKNRGNNNNGDEDDDSWDDDDNDDSDDSKDNNNYTENSKTNSKNKGKR